MELKSNSIIGTLFISHLSLASCSPALPLWSKEIGKCDAHYKIFEFPGFTLGSLRVFCWDAVCCVCRCHQVLSAPSCGNRGLVTGPRLWTYLCLLTITLHLPLLSVMCLPFLSAFYQRYKKLLKTIKSCKEQRGCECKALISGPGGAAAEAPVIVLTRAVSRITTFGNALLNLR